MIPVNAPVLPPHPDFSPYSLDSEQDVTAYAESVVERIEQAERANQLTAELLSSNVPNQDCSLPDPLIADLTQGLGRSITPLPDPGRGDTMANLSGLESVLHIATTSSSLLPELRLTTDPASQLQEQGTDPAGEDTTSSVQGAPDFPLGNPRIVSHPATVDRTALLKIRRISMSLSCTAEIPWTWNQGLMEGMSLAFVRGNKD